MQSKRHTHQCIIGESHHRWVIRRLIMSSTCIFGLAITGCSDQQGTGSDTVMADPDLHSELRTLLREQGGALGLDAFKLPESDDFLSIPQDPNNPLTTEKVALGELLFHDTGFALNGLSPDETGSWSCATCHHADAGFKSGVAQGIGEGGIGFGDGGSERTLAIGFDVNAELGAQNLPDLQPLASPTILNSAFQDVMLWNGQFGNSASGSVNTGLPDSLLMTPDTPKVDNNLQLSGLETQAIAGISVHRMKMSPDTPLQNNSTYRGLWEAVFGSDAVNFRENAGKAIAAYERTVLSNKAPFQMWLRGDSAALSENELKGGLLFFGKAGCVQCHSGPALSSEPGASQDDMFFAVGFDDFDGTNDRVHLADTVASQLGRADLTHREEDNYKFKIPPLYNLADADVFGHGASFSSIDEVLAYKNAGIAQNEESVNNLDARFLPLNLDDDELAQLSEFLTRSLYDPDLHRYQPLNVPSGSHVIVDSFDW